MLIAMLGLGVVAPAVAGAHNAQAKTAAADKIAPLEVTASVTPKLRRHAPFTYTVSGTVRPPIICPAGATNPSYCSPAPCRGEVRITAGLPHGESLTVTAPVSDTCEFSETITIRSKHFKLKRRTRHHTFVIDFDVRYLGNSVLSAKNAPTVTAEAVRFH